MTSRQDIYLTSGDADLASMSGSDKQFTMCSAHNSPKEMFHYQSCQTLCSQCLVDKQIERESCVEARVFC